MDKEKILMLNYLLLSPNPQKNHEALKSLIQQLIELNPELGIECWEDIINKNITEIEKDFEKTEFSYNNIGRILVSDFETEFCRENYFIPALKEYTKRKNLLNIIYSKSPINKYFSGTYVISYLIRKGCLQEADAILSAIYENKKFSYYSELWNNIIDKFKYGEHYHPSVYFSVPIKQPKYINEFCINWIKKIKDKEEQAGAITFAMKMF